MAYPKIRLVVFGYFHENGGSRLYGFMMRVDDNRKRLPLKNHARKEIYGLTDGMMRDKLSKSMGGGYHSDGKIQ